MTLQSSVGGVGPVRMVKVTCAGLAMVTFLSWMANVRTSFFTVQAPVGIWNGLTLRSVGSNSMFLLVLCLRTGVACCLPTCAQGSSVPVMVNTVNGVFLCFEVGGGITLVTSGEFAGKHQKLLVILVLVFLVFINLSCTCQL